MRQLSATERNLSAMDCILEAGVIVLVWGIIFFGSIILLIEGVF